MLLWGVIHVATASVSKYDLNFQIIPDRKVLEIEIGYCMLSTVLSPECSTDFAERWAFQLFTDINTK